jgi:hypothetical protein
MVRKNLSENDECALREAFAASEAEL